MTCTTHENGHVQTILPPFLAVVVRRVPLPRDWSTMLVFPGYAIDQSRIDVEEVDPNFVRATLICFLGDPRHRFSVVVVLPEPSSVGVGDGFTAVLVFLAVNGRRRRCSFPKKNITRASCVYH